VNDQARLGRRGRELFAESVLEEVAVQLGQHPPHPSLLAWSDRARADYQNRSRSKGYDPDGAWEIVLTWETVRALMVLLEAFGPEILHDGEVLLDLVFRSVFPTRP